MMKTPFVGRNTLREIGGQRALFVAVLEVGDGYLCVEYQIGIAQVVLFAAKKRNFSIIYTAAKDPVLAVVADLKALALDKGATLEAIQLLGSLTQLTKEDENTMAGVKLAKKAAAAEPAAKPAKVAKGGNTAALDEARKARAAKNDAQKIKVVAKENPYREGTKAAATFDLFKENNGKTVGDVRAAADADAHDLGYLRYASRDGHITLT